MSSAHGIITGMKLSDAERAITHIIASAYQLGVTNAGGQASGRLHVLMENAAKLFDELELDE